MEKSWVFPELYATRNSKNAFKYGGLWGGLTLNGISGYLKGYEPWNLRNKVKDSE